MTDRPLLPDSEPWSSRDGGPHGVLVLHGYTGSPSSMRALAKAFAGAGFHVELPLLPGHGTTPEDLAATTFRDWLGAAEEALARLQADADRVVVAGLSMGGALTVWLAATHPELAGIVTINPVVEAPAASFREALETSIAQGVEFFPAVGSDIADPAFREVAYDRTPLRPLITAFDAGAELAAKLPDITCPVLIFTSPNDHVVEPSSSDFLAAHVSGPVERVTCERSFHVATLDYDKHDIERRAVDFARKVTSG
jgi:carboxylesterase